MLNVLPSTSSLDPPSLHLHHPTQSSSSMPSLQVCHHLVPNPVLIHLNQKHTPSSRLNSDQKLTVVMTQYQSVHYAQGFDSVVE